MLNTTLLVVSVSHDHLLTYSILYYTILYYSMSNLNLTPYFILEHTNYSPSDTFRSRGIALGRHCSHATTFIRGQGRGDRVSRIADGEPRGSDV